MTVIGLCADLSGSHEWNVFLQWEILAMLAVKTRLSERLRLNRVVWDSVNGLFWYIESSFFSYPSFSFSGCHHFIQFLYFSSFPAFCHPLTLSLYIIFGKLGRPDNSYMAVSVLASVSAAVVSFFELLWWQSWRKRWRWDAFAAQPRKSSAIRVFLEGYFYET